MQSVKELLPFSKPFRVLYVEDDTGIRDNYTKVFQGVFKSVDVAEDGKEGLEKFRSNSYDLVITDINMPRMNGIEMIEGIFESHPHHMIIVTSAHDDSQYLLKLIDLGIEKFLIKPVDFNKMTQVLYRSCKHLTEQKELLEYQNRIEEENLRFATLMDELRKKNKELERTVFKYTQEENVNTTLVDGIKKEKNFSEKELEFYSPHSNGGTISALDFATHFTGNIEFLSDKLEAVEETLELNIHQKLSTPTPESILEMSEAFFQYASHLDSTFKFANLAHALRHLSGVFSTLDDYSPLSDIKPLLFGIADSLHRWRLEVLVNQKAEDIHFLDNSIISDCMQTESMLCEHKGHCNTDIDDIFF